MIIARTATASASSFFPADISPVLWLDAADTATITESGGAVSQWDNKGTLSNFEQSTAAYQPTTGVSTLNGLNVIDFAGDYMIQPSGTQNEYTFFYNGDSYLLAAVIQPGTTANPGVLYGFCGNSRASSTYQGGTVFFDDSSVNNGLAHNIYRRVAGSSVVLNTAANVITPNTFSVVSVLADPDNATAADRSKTYIDAGSANANNTQTNAPNTDPADRRFEIGSVGGALYTLTGSIAEMIIVHGADATNANRELLRDYLNDKWGVY